MLGLLGKGMNPYPLTKRMLMLVAFKFLESKGIPNPIMHVKGFKLSDIETVITNLENCCAHGGREVAQIRRIRLELEHESISEGTIWVSLVREVYQDRFGIRQPRDTDFTAYWGHVSIDWVLTNGTQEQVEKKWKLWLSHGSVASGPEFCDEPTEPTTK